MAVVVVLGREDGVEEDQDAGEQQDGGRDGEETPFGGVFLWLGVWVLTLSPFVAEAVVVCLVTG